MSEFFVKYGPMLYLIQLFFAIIIGMYFWNLLKGQQSRKTVLIKDSEKKLTKLKQMRDCHLTEPLSSLTRPACLNDVVGQSNGLDMLRSALCGPNPQHVIIYGSPGVGKTAAARLVLEEAKTSSLSPFKKNAQFVEVDATISRFDERNIADPLIGSVHDPIYQGAGAMGAAGIPQPKPGACTRAHGGILFIDEIGELPSVQMNKLLKILEDRKVMLESAYYTENDINIPRHIHDIFQNGLPADFRLVGATTRMPQEIPPALRSRCIEIFFKPLEKSDIKEIVVRAIDKIKYNITPDALEEIIRYAANGREAINIVQLAAGIVQLENSQTIDLKIVEKVLNNGTFSPRADIKIKDKPYVGMVNGLAVCGPNLGTLIEVEAVALPVIGRQGVWTVTGVVDEEEMEGAQRTYRRKSMARGAVENVLTVLRSHFNIQTDDFDIHLNFPGGTPVEGPSAGISMATAIYSAIKNIEIDNWVAMTGEVSVHGEIKPVGGIMSKIDAARRAGIKKVIIPADNWLNMFADFPETEIIPVKELEQVLSIALARTI